MYVSVILVALSVNVNKYLSPENPTGLIGLTKSVYINDRVVLIVSEGLGNRSWWLSPEDNCHRCIQ